MVKFILTITLNLGNEKITQEMEFESATMMFGALSIYAIDSVGYLHTVKIEDFENGKIIECNASEWKEKTTEEHTFEFLQHIIIELGL